MVVFPLADCSAEEDSASIDLFTVATRVIVRRTAHFVSSGLFQHQVEFLAAKVTVVMVVWPHFRVH